VSHSAVVDYYAILNLPATVDLAGVENAYARISDELALMTEVDAACSEALQRVNEAYSVLSRPELRRKYDRVYFAADHAAAEHKWRSIVRRRVAAQWLLIGSLSLVVIFQAAVLAYLGGLPVGSFLSTIFGTIIPGGG
jgi:hypothetical protein